MTTFIADFQEFFYVFYRFALFAAVVALIVSSLFMAAVELMRSVNAGKLSR